MLGILSMGQRGRFEPPGTIMPRLGSRTPRRSRKGERWVRPDLNWSHQHPKLGGFQATPRTHCQKGLRGLAEGNDLVDEVRVRDDHSPAAVASYSEIVKDLLRIFPKLDPLHEGLVGTPYHLAASEASNRDDHLFTCRTSAASSSRPCRVAFSAASCADR